MFDEMMKYTVKPPLYALSTNLLWDDEHISKGMLEAHLNPEWDAATRKHDFVDKSVSWITRIAPPSQFTQLLDLGCGPGLYAERFNHAGYSVTGIDFSRRSIEYAKEQAACNNSDICYRCQNYLTAVFTEQYDVITMIFCDYAVLAHADRLMLLKKIYEALRPGGKLILDVFTPHMRHDESHSWYRAENGGFYSDKPHVCMESFYQYNDADKTELRQAIVITEDSVECYNIWDHFFDRGMLVAEIMPAGFSSYELFGSVAGDEFSDCSETICGVFTK